MSVETESKVFEVDGRKYRVTPWSAWTGFERGLKIAKILGPSLEAVPTCVQSMGGTSKEQHEALGKILVTLAGLEPELMVKTCKELCEGIFSIERNCKIDVETYFNEYPGDIALVVWHTAMIQLSPFFPASIRDSFSELKPLKSLKT